MYVSALLKDKHDYFYGHFYGFGASQRFGNRTCSREQVRM